MIEATGLTMHYGPVVALNNVSFEVKKGEIVGLLGPNGAGKSTTMKILTTYLHPTSGSAKVGGIDVLKDPLGVRKIIGYLPETLPLYMDMEVRTYLNFVGKARGLSGSELKRRVDAVVDQCGLAPMFRKLIRELSKGYKQRTALAQALVHDPSIVILDEPTSGLDPRQIREVRKLIDNLAETKTVILSTHILQEIEASADRIVIINRGEIVGDGTLDELRARAQSEQRVLVRIAGDGQGAQGRLSAIPGVTSVEQREDGNGFASFLLLAKQDAPVWREVGQLARQHDWELRELSEKAYSLEETFHALTQHKQGEVAA